jgi:aminoglycoside phosphotransferase (APT) family kinase protein
VTEPHWQAIYAQIAQSDAAPVAGYYNRNYFKTTDGQRVVLRVPIPGAADMDIRLLPEPAVLQVADNAGLRVPKVLAVSADPPFQVHEYISGARLDEIAPRGTGTPLALLEDITSFFDVLWRTPSDRLRMPAGWPASGDTPSFFGYLVAHVQRAYDAAHNECGSLFQAVGVPDSPLAEVRAHEATLSPRQFTLIHCDVHRKNCILSQDVLWYLDWELALIADPVYDLAVHLHKMGYIPDDEAHLLDRIAAQCGPLLGKNWEIDLATYRSFERKKSVLIDTIRYSQQMREPNTPASLRHTLIEKWREKLGATQPLWNNRVPDEDEAAALLSKQPK